MPRRRFIASSYRLTLANKEPRSSDGTPPWSLVPPAWLGYNLHFFAARNSHLWRGARVSGNGYRPHHSKRGTPAQSKKRQRRDTAQPLHGNHRSLRVGQVI